ncbi:MAG: sodium-dependent bicarbonate transport family permease [Methylophilaceae bacterium]|nr:sodium-dependent bicarbonate transport family permease [Methylophilaceae bacterium]
MNLSAIQNLLDPPILFFFLGCLMAMVRSNIDIPPAITRFFSLYLLMAIGFKGGVALSTSPLGMTALATLAGALVLAVLLPLLAYAFLVRQLSAFDAAAVAAAYGSVSAITFITATQYLERQGVAFGGHMMVAMVLMESPAIVMAILLAQHARQRTNSALPPNPEIRSNFGGVLREALTDGSQLLLLGSLMIGAIVGLDGKKIMDPFTGQIFKGILAFFMLEMGLTVVRKGQELERGFHNLIPFGILMPLVGAILSTLIAIALRLGQGDALLLVVLGASASYIVVPAVLRHAIPEANPSIYFGSALVVTFPFNIVFGIPLYHWVLTRML